MKCEKIHGGTLDYAELIVDYTKSKKDRLKIKGIGEKSKFNTVTTALYEWAGFLFKYFIGLAVAIALIYLIIEGDSDIFFKIILPIVGAVWLVTTITLGLFHLNPKFDKKWKKFFVIRTGEGDRNKATFTNFDSKLFVIHKIDNKVLEYNATKDVARQLYKVWIKEEPPTSFFEHQAVTKGALLLKTDVIWNAYFFFKRRPKNGELYVEWI